MPEKFDDGIVTTNLSVDGIDVTNHHIRHEAGGADELDITGLQGTTSDAQNIEVLEEGVSVGTRTKLNFAGMSVTAIDNPGDGRVDVTITAASLTTSAPTTIQPDDTASVGIALDAAKADHKHAIVTDTAIEITDSTSAEGTATSFARADHQHAHGNRGGGSLHADATTLTAGFMSAADKTKLDASGILTSSTPTSIEPDDTSIIGTATESARADHQHAIITDTAGTINVGDTATEGIASSFSRSDHQHSLPMPAAPVDVTKSAASAGVATTVARADHKHDISTAAPSSTGTTNTEGTATSLARSDHIHRTLVALQEEGAAVASRPTLNFIGAGITAVDNPGSDRVDITIVSTPQAIADTFRWTGIGVITVIANLDGAWIAPRAGTISRITLHRHTAGSSGTTTIDVNKNQITVFTTQANRPAVTAASGNNQISVHTDMDIASFAQNDQFQIDVDTAEIGAAKDISVIMEVQYT